MAKGGAKLRAHGLTWHRMDSVLFTSSPYHVAPDSREPRTPRLAQLGTFSSADGGRAEGGGVYSISCMAVVV